MSDNRKGSNLTASLTVRIPTDIREILDTVSVREERSITKVLIRAIRLYEAAGRDFDEEAILHRIAGIREN